MPISLRSPQRQLAGDVVDEVALAARGHLVDDVRASACTSA
jgi:hypothetical protein